MFLKNCVVTGVFRELKSLNVFHALARATIVSPIRLVKGAGGAVLGSIFRSSGARVENHRNTYNNKSEIVTIEEC